MSNKKIAKKIIQIGEPLVSMVLSMAGMSVSNELNVCEIDIVSAIEQLDSHATRKIEHEIESYRTFTACYVKYGYKRVFGKNKQDALENATLSGIVWNETECCIKATSGEFLHEFRIKGPDGMRVLHIGGKREAMHLEEIKSTLLKMNAILPDTSYLIKYTFISSSYIVFEKDYEI